MVEFLFSKFHYKFILTTQQIQHKTNKFVKFIR